MSKYCKWPEGPKCFAFKKSECSILKDTSFRGCTKCPFFKTYSEVIKEDPDFFRKQDQVLSAFKSGITHSRR